jgi:uncharacterized protein (TIGR03437 family)
LVDEIQVYNRVLSTADLQVLANPVGGPARKLPQITSVANAAGGQPGVVPGAFVSIYGANFTDLPYDDWSKSIVDGKLPTKLDGVSVSIDGKPAYIYAITPNQINLQAPDVSIHNMQVTVTTTAGTSQPFATNAQQFGPAFFTWPANQPVATRVDYSLAVKNGTFAGSTTIAAKPGEVITLWGTGFGPTDPNVLAGELPGSNAGVTTRSPVTITLDGANVTVFGTALSAFPALFQTAIQIPSSISNGDHELVAMVNGVVAPTVLLTVER